MTTTERPNRCSVRGCPNEAVRIERMTGYIPVGHTGKTVEEQVFVVVCESHVHAEAKR